MINSNLFIYHIKSIRFNYIDKQLYKDYGYNCNYLMFTNENN